MFQKDRDLAKSKKKDGGGVLLAVNNMLSCCRRQDLKASLEILWIEVRLDSVRWLFIGNVYLSPGSEIAIIDEFQKSLDKVSAAIKPTDTILLLGDFNLPGIIWLFKEDDNYAIPSNASTNNQLSYCFLDPIQACALQQYSTLPTCNNHVLDLVFTNDMSAGINYADKVTMSNHEALDIALKGNVTTKAQMKKRTKFNYKKADNHVIFRLLTCISWSSFESVPTINSAPEHFYDMVFAVIRDAVPSVCFNPEMYPPWYNAELISVLKRKISARRKFISLGRAKGSPEHELFRKIHSEL